MMRSTLSTPVRAPRLRLTLAAQIVGAPHPFIETMSTPELLARSEMLGDEETPGRRDYDVSGAYELTEDWWAKIYGVGEEEDDDDNKVKDPDYEGEKPQSRKRAAAAGDGPRKRGDGQREREGPRAIILDDAGFPLWPGGLRKQLRDCNAAEAKAYHEAIAKRDAAADAAGADELKAAVSAFDTSPLAEKDNYVAIVDEVKSWAKRGGTKATAAKWIRCLVSKGKDKLTPSRVRLNYTRTPPGAA